LSRTIFREGVRLFKEPLKKFLDKTTHIPYNTVMKKYKRKPWTVKERELLAFHYYNSDISTMLIMLPDRTQQSIRNQVSYLKKRNYRFKPQERTI
jgi:hypothetical protein